MAVIVLQPHGIGDHIFCQSLVHQISDRQDIIWPALPHFLSGLRRAYPDVNWVPAGFLGPQIENCKQDRVINGNRILPIRWADQLLRKPYKDCMRAKYDLYGLDWNSWKDFEPNFNSEKGESLLYDVLKVGVYEPFRLINRRFTSMESKSVNIPESKEIRNIEMTSIHGYSLFDWYHVIQSATEIHTVGTSINYLIELLDIKAKEVVLYKRMPDENHFENYDYILTRHKYVFNA